MEEVVVDGGLMVILSSLLPEGGYKEGKLATSHKTRVRLS
jgi:hypothetical protein